MTEIDVVKFTSKEEAVKAKPKLEYEYRDVRRAATVGFSLSLLGLFIVILSPDESTGWFIVELIESVMYFGLSFLIFHNTKAAVKYYLGIIIFSSLLNIHESISQENFDILLIVFQLIPVLIVVGLIQPAYSSMAVINNYVENPIEKATYFKVIKYHVYIFSWCMIVLYGLAMITLISSL